MVKHKERMVKGTRYSRDIKIKMVESYERAKKGHIYRIYSIYRIYNYI